MVTMEAWTYKIPVLANSKSDVLKGHCEKSNGGLYYENYNEFEKCLNFLLNNQESSHQLGENGSKYVKKNYDWNTMINEYRDFIEFVHDSISKNIEKKD